MTYNTIMVRLEVDGDPEPRLRFAMDLARRFEADLIGIAAAELRVTVARDRAPGLASETVNRQTQELQEKLKSVREAFLSIAGDDERRTFRGEIGVPGELAALHSRAADLIVTGPAGADAPAASEAGALALHAGRPVLVAAQEHRLLDGRKVLVAWKDGREARRAVADAMPFLKQAREVLLAQIAEGDPKAAAESAADVVRFLMRHGVRARAETREAGRSDPAHAVVELAREFGADLVVSGAYGHSRLREWAFGGMTRSLLRDDTVHRLLSN